MSDITRNVSMDLRIMTEAHSNNLENLDFRASAENPEIKSYFSDVAAFFGHLVSWLCEGNGNQTLRKEYVDAVMARIKQNPAIDATKFGIFLNNVIDTESRMPISARSVQQVENAFDEEQGNTFAVREDAIPVSSGVVSERMHSTGVFTVVNPAVVMQYAEIFENAVYHND